MTSGDLRIIMNYLYPLRLKIPYALLVKHGIRDFIVLVTIGMHFNNLPGIRVDFYRRGKYVPFVAN